MSEILAPAGSREQLEAAVRSGADAVYFGAKDFNARRNADNFDDICHTVRYCHERGVKAHIAVNTLICDDQTDRLFSLIKEIADSGADAVIVQDLGVADAFKRLVPDLPLHASTQLAVHDINGAKQLEDMGFSRIVLARELTLGEIGNIAKNTSLETEVFIHGALCMSVSGCCYLSSMLGGRSGNRGLCAQPCRLDFKSDGRHFVLSLKDMCHIKYLKDLEDAGVCSFKIEGRMKRPEYVAAAVNACIAAREGKNPDLDTLQRIFSRSGFTDGYLTGRRTSDMFGHRTKEDVTAADGVFSKISGLYKNEYKRIGLDAALFVKSGQPAKLTVVSDKGETTVYGDIAQKAINRPLDRETAEKQISKTGGTPFFIHKFELFSDRDIMLPIPSLNAMRRQVLERQTELFGTPVSYGFKQPERDMPTNIPPHAKTPKPLNGRPEFIIRGESFEQIEGIKTAARYILPMEEIAAHPEKAENYGEFLFAELPPLMFDCQNPEPTLTLLKSLGITTLSAENIGGIYLARKHGFGIHCGHGMNILNSLSLKAVKQLGAQSATLSFELSAKRISLLSDGITKGAIVYGYLPLMRFRNCPARGEKGCGGCNGSRILTDRKGIDFNITCFKKRFCTLLNSRPLVLSDKKLDGLDFMTLYFTVENADRCSQVYDAYVNRLPIDGEKTNGLYFRELL